MCLYPRLIKNPKYKANKKNGGKVPEVTDPRVLYVPIGCGDCIECRNQEARKWQLRLLEDIKTNTNGKFVTLTLSDESIAQLHTGLERLKGYALDNAIATKAVRRWLERWRKRYKKSLRHWLVTELGHNGTKNVHLHGIVWTDKAMLEVEETWNYGFVWKGKYFNGKYINYVGERTVNYMVKYVRKMDEENKTYKPKVLTSAGIGANYINRLDARRNKYNGEETIETYKTRTGHEIGLPIYWRNKIYTDEEREKLWLQRLDKNERWVCGDKVDADNYNEYLGLLLWHRMRNAELGYGTGEKDWDRIEYEKALRQLRIEERIQKGKKKLGDAFGPG